MEYGMLLAPMMKSKKKRKWEYKENQLEKMGDLIEDNEIQTQLGQTKLEME